MRIHDRPKYTAQLVAELQPFAHCQYGVCGQGVVFQLHPDNFAPPFPWWFSSYVLQHQMLFLETGWLFFV